MRSIAREAERMGRLVADLLLLARADAGQRLERRPLALDALLLDVYGQCRALADGVRFEIDELEQVEVDGDPDRLKQLLLNLVDNAFRHTPAGAPVRVAVARHDGVASVVVEDRGPGMSREDRENAFQRFTRGRGSTGGSGLGLALCREIVAAHGGRIDLVSEAGRGTRVVVELP